MSLLLSVVVPVHNEVANIGPLVAEIHAELDGAFESEVVCVDDGSDDGTADLLAALAADDPYLRVVCHARRAGQSAALVSGVRAARGTWIATLDGDGQNDPADIPRLLATVRDPAAPAALRLIVGNRRRRQDSIVKRWSSRVARAARARLLGDATPDTGCGIKLFHRESFLGLPPFDHMHRFLPVLFARSGWRVTSVEVNHRPRRHGRSHYGVLDRLWAGVVDLAGVMWLQRRPVDAPLAKHSDSAVMDGRGTPAADAPDGRLSGTWLVLWGVAVALALAVRPLLPIDETRYLSVAWEMWRRHDWLVPHLNGVPYSDKPPLLFWSILAGWRIFGVGEWWPRLLSPLFGLASVALALRLGRRLAPERGTAGVAGPVPLFLSGALWVTYSTLVLFDTLLTLCVLVALTGVLDAWSGRPRRGWLLYGLGLGLGGLAKGPVVLLHALPVALLAPWWGIGARPASWRRWYLGVAAGVGLGLAIGCSWAIAAAMRGGPEYCAAILWGQTAGRVARAFAHRRPWWWYFPLLPVLLFPWALWPPLWRALTGLRRGPAQRVVRFALAWCAPAFVALSLISGKQVHYLIPLLPAFALLAAAAWARVDGIARRGDMLLPAGALAALGLALLAAPAIPALARAARVGAVSPVWGLVPLAGALILAITREPRWQLRMLSWVAPGLLVLAHLLADETVLRAHDLRPVASFLRNAELDGRPVAYVGKYSGQFHFLGRLDTHFDEILPDQAARWAVEHPTGLVVRRVRSAAATNDALMTQPYRDGLIGVWSAMPVTQPQAPVQHTVAGP